MPGLRIMHYMVDLGYHEPTRIYAIMQLDNGDLKMEKILEVKNMSVEDIAWWWSRLDIKRPVVLVDPYPPVLQHLKAKGIRVR